MKAPQLSKEVCSRLVEAQDIINSVVALNDAMSMAASCLEQRYEENALHSISRCISERLDKLDELLDGLLGDDQQASEGVR